MRANKLGKIFGVASLSLVLMLSAGTDAFAQGKGKGGGGGHGGGNGNGNGGGKHQDRGNGGGDQGRGNGGGGWKHQGGGPPQVQAQPQYRPQPQQQRQIWQQAPQQVFQARGNGNGRGNGKGKIKQAERRVYNAPQMDYRRQERRVYNAPQIQQQWGGGRVPPGQIRKQEVHARNAERKAVKEQEKAYRRYERENRDAYVPRPVYRSYDRSYDADRYQYRTRQPRTYDRSYDGYQYQGPVAPQYNPGYFGYDPYQYQYRSPVYNSGYYDQNYYGDEYGYEDGSSWKQQLLRTLISSVLGGYLNRDGGDYAYNGYDNGGYDSYYANGPVRYAYTQPLYSRAGYSPSYAGYGQSYLPYSSYGQDYGYDYDDYDQGSGGLLGSLPIGGFFSGGRGGFLSQILGQVVAQGYLQGLLEGQAAKEYGYADENYYDPYVGSDGIYDPFSTSIGENRRLMSEGYDLGYEDALAGREQFDPEDVGNIDLVSLLLGNVFRLG